MDQTYLNTNINNLLDNFNNIKTNYNYDYYLIDVSNNAFNHGMYIINYLNLDNIYLYVNNFKDLKLLRYYNSNIPVIYSGYIDNDNIYDLIINNAILLIKDINILEDIKENINIILDINKDNGIYTKNKIEDLLNIMKNNNKINLLGIISYVTKDNYLDIKYLLDYFKDLKIRCLNNELDKNKIKLSNTLKLDYSIYGFNLKKDKISLKTCLTLKTKIIKINKERKKKKEILEGIIYIGYLNGLSKNIKEVIINDKTYNILSINREYTIIDIDSEVNIDDWVIINIKQDNLVFSNYPIMFTKDKEEIYS